MQRAWLRWRDLYLNKEGGECYLIYQREPLSPWSWCAREYFLRMEMLRSAEHNWLKTLNYRGFTHGSASRSCEFLKLPSRGVPCFTAAVNGWALGKAVTTGEPRLLPYFFLTLSCCSLFSPIPWQRGARGWVGILWDMGVVSNREDSIKRQAVNTKGILKGEKRPCHLARAELCGMSSAVLCSH